MNASEELPAKGLTVTFIKKIEDVTIHVPAKYKSRPVWITKDSIMQAAIKEIEMGEKRQPLWCVCKTVLLWYRYYLFVTEGV